MNQATVYIVDDDRAVRDSLCWVLESAGYRVATFDSAERFLTEAHVALPACLVLDVAMPGLTGLELQQQLQQQAADLPIIFISAHGTVPAAVSAMRHGAVDFLMKPFNNHALLQRVQEAIALSRTRQTARTEEEALAARMAPLSAREREVLDAVVQGLTSKEVARRLGISVKTVESHRANIMTKTGAHTLAELVRLAVTHHG